MKYLFLVLIILLIIEFIRSETAEIYSLDEANVENLWLNFKSDHQKGFRTTSHESERRLIFVENLKKINQHNAEFNKKKVTYSLGITKFADMNSTEFMNYVNKGINKLKINKKAIIIETYKYPTSIQLPFSIDWRTKGYVNPVQDQDSCGSCWAFSTVASVEGQYFKKYKKLLKFSEQNLVDCVMSKYLMNTGADSDGCNGGDGNIAFKYINKYGLNLLSSYPYTSGATGTWSGRCKYNALKTSASIAGYVVIPSNETILASAIANVGPLRTALYVSVNFQLYKSGVFIDNPSCPKSSLDANYEVNLVGYGSLNNNDYYILRNQWGAQWGMKGYMLFARNRNNQCGIASDSSYPIMN